MENNNYISQKKFRSLFFWGACFILFLPIVILPPTFQPNEWSRVILFKIILTVLISFLLFEFFYKKEISISVPKWKNPVYLPLLILSAFFITLILSTLFSQDPVFSVFGSPQRAGGVLNLLFFFAFACFLALFTDENNWKKLFNALFVAGVLISSLTIVQYFNILKDVFVSFEEGGTPSFLGNSTFLAIYMLFLSILSFTYFLQEKEKKKKVTYGVLFLLFTFTILVTNARATYLGLLIGFFYFFFFYPVRSKVSSGINPKNLKTLKIIAAGLVLFAIIAVIVFNFFPQISEKNNLLKIAADRLSIKKIVTDLAGTRFLVWKIALQTIEDKPILGWGPENFYIGFEKYYDPTVPIIKNTWWDRPHNVFLEIAANSGIMSLIFYSLFWIVLFCQLQIFKIQRGEGKDIYLAHGIQAMFIGYLVALFFNFDSFPTYIISFFFVGYSLFLLSKNDEKKIVCPPKTNFFKKKFVYIPLLMILISFIWFLNIKPLYINEKINYGQNLINAKRCGKAMSIADNVWQNSGILKFYAGIRYADFIKKCADSKSQNGPDYIFTAYKALKISSEAQPKFTRTWLFLGGFTNALAAKEQNPETQKKMLAEAIGYLKKGLELSPKRQEIIIEMEKNYLIAKDYQTVKKMAEDCLKIDSNYGQCFWYLGIAEIFLGDQKNGKKHIQKSQEGGVTPPYVQLGVAYISQKNYKDAAEAYRMATVYNDDKNASYYAVLAFLYKQTKEYEKAGKATLRVFELQPENKDAMDFLEQLLGLSPNDPSLHSSLAYIYKQTGKTEKSRQEYLITKSLYEQAVAQYPKEGTYHFNLAGVSKELGEYEQAYYEAVLAEKIDPGLKNNVLDFMYTLPENYIERYRYKK